MNSPSSAHPREGGDPSGVSAARLRFVANFNLDSRLRGNERG
jgi:hypothetical protein